MRMHREPLIVSGPSTLALVLNQVRQERLDAKRVSQAKRIAGSPRHPSAVELFYTLACKRFMMSIAAALKNAALPLIKKSTKPDVKTDAVEAVTHLDAKVTSYMRGVARRAFSRGLPVHEARSKQAADRVQLHSKKEFERLKIKVDKEPELKWLVNGWLKDATQKVREFTDYTAGRMAKILEDAGNRHPDTVKQDILDLVGGISERRAEHLARKLVTQLNSKINRHRYKAAHIKVYTWTTMMDERVRDEHQELEGEVFDVDGDGDPEEGHPGDAENCRCVAYPGEPEDEEDSNG